MQIFNRKPESLQIARQLADLVIRVKGHSVVKDKSCCSVYYLSRITVTASFCIAHYIHNFVLYDSFNVNALDYPKVKCEMIDAKLKGYRWMSP